jgi:glycosyltransferase involved in cell wall biosynthesis
MNILYIVEASGGVGRHLFDLIDGLSKKGHVISLAYSKARMDPQFEVIIDRLSQRGVNTIEIGMARGPTIVDFYVLLRLLFVHCKYGPFDLVHGHSSKGGALARIIAPLMRSKSIYTPHAFYSMNLGLSAFKLWLYKKIEFLLARLGDAIILTSNQEVDHSHFLHLPPSSIYLIHNGSNSSIVSREDVEAFQSTCNIKHGDFIFGFVGRLEYQKNPEFLIEAFSKLALTRQNLKLVMVGDGVLRHRLEELAKKLGISKYVIFPGFYPSTIAMESFDVFVLPSRYEGSPYVLHDAALAGLPIISTNVGGTDILVQDGENGFLVEQDNVDALYTAMRFFTETPLVASKLGAISSKLMEKYSVDDMVNQTLNLYKKIVAKK